MINSPLNMPQTPPFGPPIVPGLTELPPHKMRAVMRGGYDEDPESLEDPDEQLSPGEIVAKVGKLAYFASQFGPDLLDVVIEAVKAVKTAQITTAMDQTSQMMAASAASPLMGGLSEPPMPPQPQPSRQAAPSPPFPA